VEVKPGYKLTEVGVIPEDWGVSKVGHEFDVQLGKMLDSEKNTGVPKQYLGNRNVQWGKIDIAELSVMQMTRMDMERFRLQAGDLLVCEGGEIGRAAIWLAPLDECYYQKALHRLRPLRGFNSKLMAEFLRMLSDQGGFANYVTQTSIAHLPKEKLIEIPLPVPTKSEQQAIATALSDMDALLDGLDRLIAKKRAIKQAAMQQLLTGKTRLPGFSGEWEVKRLRELTDMNSGGTPATTVAAYYGGYIPWVSISDISQGGKFIYSTEKLLTQLGLNNCAAKIFPEKTVLYAMYASIGECSIAGKPMCTSQAVLGIRVKPALITDFLYYYLASIKDQVKNLGQQGAQANLNAGMVRGFEIKLPSVKEQTAIAIILSDIDTEITVLETRRAKTRALKQAMMQELLTGRTRLLEPDAKPVEEAATHTEGRKANIHFLRSVLAAEIIDQLHDQPTFGHVKFEKMMFLTEYLCDVDTGSTYRRKAAGPYDNLALRSIDSQLHKQQWFDAQKKDGRYQYVPMAKRGGHRQYFNRYFSEISDTFGKIMTTFKIAKTEKCEIVATLLAAWSDLLREQGTVSDEMIVHEVLHNWHESKQRIPEDRWLKALAWMREKGFVPKEVA